MSGLLHNSDGDNIVRYEDGSSYTGNMISGLRSGKGREEHIPVCLTTGRCTFATRLDYQGEFANDQRCGFGHAVMAFAADDGRLPIGPDDACCILRTPTTVKYEGHWRAGLPNGEGRLLSIHEGAVYTGQLRNGCPDGPGLLESPAGSYRGEFRCGLRHGAGRIEYRCKDVYDGEWRDDERCGAGRLYESATCNTYDGEWMAEQKHGNGVDITYGVCNYTGEFRSGKRHGRGVLRYFNNSETYDGEFADDVYHGQGELRLASGDVHSGVFRSGALHGAATTTFKNGVVFCGEYIEGSTRSGEMRCANGDRYVGEFSKNTVRHGKGVMYFAGGGRLECTWTDGLLHGTGLHVAPDGSQACKTYVDGAVTASAAEGELPAATAEESHDHLRADSSKQRSESPQPLAPQRGRPLSLASLRPPSSTHSPAVPNTSPSISADDATVMSLTATVQTLNQAIADCRSGAVDHRRLRLLCSNRLKAIEALLEVVQRDASAV